MAMDTSGEDIGSNYDPKGIGANKRDFNEYSDNRKTYQNERDRISNKKHRASPLRLDEMPTILPIRACGRIGTTSLR
jgi:hypothetical protein